MPRFHAHQLVCVDSVKTWVSAFVCAKVMATSWASEKRMPHRATTLSVCVCVCVFVCVCLLRETGTAGPSVIHTAVSCLPGGGQFSRLIGKAITAGSTVDEVIIRRQLNEEALQES